MEPMVCYQQRAGWGDVQKAFGAQDDLPETKEPNAIFEKFEQDSQLRGFGLSPEGIRKEFAATGFEKRAREIYRKSHGAGAKTAPAETDLTKHAKPARVEKTRYSSGATVVAEFDERGVCTKTYLEGE